MPYAARSIADFWRRWHISLSNWLRDYLYFSLPGLRSRWKIFTYLNLVVTMLLGGLWHGASWNFVIWGLLHGVGLAVTRAVQGERKAVEPAGWRRIAGIFLTANFVCFAWIFFRSPTLEAAWTVINRIGSLTMSVENISGPVALVLAIGVLAHYFPMKWQGWVADRFAETPFYAQAAALMLLAVALQYVSATGVAPFIYTKF
jgi:D-alanyl-lipoteichoic acid acyltransferase DltB (MBOAT superfamily)